MLSPTAMDVFYSVPVIPDRKHGLGLFASDLESQSLPTLCTDLDSEQLLALDDPQSFYLAFPDASIFGTCGEEISRSSSAAAPPSECSTRTSHSGRDSSPTTATTFFLDQPICQDIDAIYHDTTHAIVSGRTSGAASATWPPAVVNQIDLSSGLNLIRSISYRPHQFSYGPPQPSASDVISPLPPSTFFPRPSPQPQISSLGSPFLPSNSHSPLMTQPSQLPQMVSANGYGPTLLTPNPSSYYVQPQSQPPPSQQLHQRLHHSPNGVFQAQPRQQLQQQAITVQQSFGQPPPQQTQMQMGLSTHSQLPSQSASPASVYQPGAEFNSSATLPNTTGISSTGYQCFSHGCGGRHFSNWGNLVRHHRERQLRSKAGAKPTCHRCGKGFTRSSARDAHVAGLKCVLGRRRRGATTAGATTASPENGDDASAVAELTSGLRGTLETDAEDVRQELDASDREGSDNNDINSEGSVKDSFETCRSADQDEMDLMGHLSSATASQSPPGMSDLNMSKVTGQNYLVPQHPHFGF